MAEPLLIAGVVLESCVCVCVCEGCDPEFSALSSATPTLPSQAGITTTLNSRCSVLAAANSVFGRWDETKGEDNIDFMPTILSRFDMIFIVKDEHNEERDVVRRRRAPPWPAGLGWGRVGRPGASSLQSPGYQTSLSVGPQGGGLQTPETLHGGPWSCLSCVPHAV